MRKRLSGQTGLRREREIETPAKVDYQQPESSGSGELLGGPQALAPPERRITGSAARSTPPSAASGGKKVLSAG